MNWYKLASFIDKVTVVSYSGDKLVLFIGGKRYEYQGVPGSYIGPELDRLKTWKNKKSAGEKASQIVRNLEKSRVKQEDGGLFL